MTLIIQKSNEYKNPKECDATLAEDSMFKKRCIKKVIEKIRQRDGAGDKLRREKLRQRWAQNIDTGDIDKILIRFTLTLTVQCQVTKKSVTAPHSLVGGYLFETVKILKTKKFDTTWQ